MLSATNLKKNILKIVLVKCVHLPKGINRIWPVEINMSVRDLFHENHVAMWTEFKLWTNIHRVRSELDLDFNLGDTMSNFDRLNNISYQCLDKEVIECKEKDVENTLTTAEKVIKKNEFSLLTGRKRAFVEEKKGPIWLEKMSYSII